MTRILLSLAVHALVFGLFLVSWKTEKTGKPDAFKRSRARIMVLEDGQQPRKSRQAKKIDLRPGFMREGVFGFRDQTRAKSNQEGVLANDDATDLMAGDLRAANIFDQLAENIGIHLDYPETLVEEGIEGFAAIDLYFDSEGLIDESRSAIMGDHRLIRGAMVRAVRAGLLSWYESDAPRLRREQYRNQHFRADFTLSYALASEESLEKIASGRYHFLRRRLINTCIYPGAVDLACAAMKVAGFIKRQTSDKYNVHAAAVRDILDVFDSKGLQGIDEEIRATSRSARQQPGESAVQS